MAAGGVMSTRSNLVNAKRMHDTQESFSANYKVEMSDGGKTISSATPWQRHIYTNEGIYC